MLIVGISGRKQSGKSTSTNLILSFYIAELGLSNKVYLNDEGEIIVSDLLGDINYAGVFDIIKNYNTNDFVISKFMNNLKQHINIHSFADPLKRDICMNLLGLTYSQCYGSDVDKNTLTKIKWSNIPGYNRSSENDITEEYMTGREVMEVIGTDIFRTIKEDIWVSRTIDIALKNNKALSIISDCRFPNEIEEIKNRGGKVIRLMRDPFNTKTLSESALDKDSYDWDNFDYIIDNRDMSLLDMSIKIQEVINDITINNNT